GPHPSALIHWHVTRWWSCHARIAPVRILGVDPGSITTGFGVIDYERGKMALVEQGAITTKRGAELADRLCRIHDELVALIGRTTPETVAVEAPFGGKNVSSLIQLAHARGVILLVARMAGLP